jgi:hypothetical protein
MDIDELWDRIVAAGHEHDYALRDTAMPGHLPSAATVVEPAADGSGRWVVYFTERGTVIDPQYYPDEDAACRAVLRDLERVPNPVHVADDTEREVAAARNDEAEQLRRQMLADMGIDPDAPAS